MPDIDLTRISPVTDAEAARLASPATFAQLASQITAVPPSAAVPLSSTVPTSAFPAARVGGPDGSWQAGPRQARRLTRRRALLTGLPLAALAGAAALLIGLLVPGTNAANSPAAIQALSFTKENGYITVIIRNPYADSSWYNADFTRHHLDITLHLIPASPSFVGAIEEMSTDSSATSGEITMISKQGSCGIDGTGCVIGFKVPLDFHGQADMSIGRPARPGEQYLTTGSIFSKGEALYGLRSEFLGQPVSKVWPLLSGHHLAIAVCRDANNNNVDPAQVPGNNYVTGIIPWAPGEVIVWTGPAPAGSGANRSAPQPAS